MIARPIRPLPAVVPALTAHHFAPLDWEQTLQLGNEYLQALVRQGKAEGTIRAYAGALTQLVRFMEARQASLDRKLLEAWQDQLTEGYSPRTRGLYHGAVRTLLRWAAANERPVPENLWRCLEPMAIPRRLPRPIPPQDLHRLLRFLAIFRPNLKHLRDRALFFYLLSTAARVSEALQLRRDDVDARVFVRQKGGSEKVLLAPPVSMEAIQDYLRHRHDDCPWLWVTLDTNKPTRLMDAAGVRMIWRRLSQRVGIPYFTTHQIRHTSATLLLDADVPIEVVAEHLGHHGLGSIRGYAEVRPERRARAVKAMESFLGDAGGPPPSPRLRP